jgi:hypothetical protein
MTRANRAYVVRIAKGEKFTDEDQFVGVSTFTLEQYQCGLRAGDQVRLRRDFHVEDADGRVKKIIPGGSVWTVLEGAVEDPNAVWLEEPDGELYSWDDDDRIFEVFERFVT